MFQKYFVVLAAWLVAAAFCAPLSCLHVSGECSGLGGLSEEVQVYVQFQAFKGSELRTVIKAGSAGTNVLARGGASLVAYIPTDGGVFLDLGIKSAYVLRTSDDKFYVGLEATSGFTIAIQVSDDILKGRAAVGSVFNGAVINVGYQAILDCPVTVYDCNIDIEYASSFDQQIQLTDGSNPSTTAAP